MAKIISSEYVGKVPVYDLTVKDYHNFIANGIVVHNCMKVSQSLAAFTPSESNKLRKAIGKKIPSLMAEMKEKFLKGSQVRVDNGDITADEVEDIWNNLEAFAGYGFNKSHSIAYSAITTIELWLRYHYPVQYITALLCNTKQGAKKSYSKNMLTYYINYARKEYIEIVPPDINISKQGFTIQDNKIVYSFAHIKNVGTCADAIVAAQPYESMEDFYERAQVERVVKGKTRYQKLNKKVVESLCKAGAFDCWGTRNEMLYEYYALRKKKNETAPEFTEDEWIAHEEEVCGICLSVPPLRMEYADKIADENWNTIERRTDVKKPYVFGRITNIRSQTSKRSGNQMYNCEISDGMDTLNFYVFTAAMEYWRQHVKMGYIVVVPMKSFEDSETYFFDDRREVIVVKK
jgi:DNA polymerase III alpha subunit